MTGNELKALKSLKDSNEEAKRKINAAKGVFKVNYFFQNKAFRLVHCFELLTNQIAACNNHIESDYKKIVSAKNVLEKPLFDIE